MRCLLIAVVLAGIGLNLTAEPIVIVDDIPIDGKVVDRYMRQFKGALSKEEYRERRADYVAETIKLHLKRQFAEKELSHIEVTDEELKTSLEAVKRDIRKDPKLKGLSFEEILAFQGLTLEAIMARQKNNIRYVKYLESLVKEEECASSYKAHPEFYDGSRIRASHIFFKMAGKTEAEQQAIVRKAQELQAELTDPEQTISFSRKAREVSEHETAERGGDVGYFRRIGDMPDSFAKAAFALEVGEISGIIATEAGLHILKITDKRKGSLNSYEECRGMVKAYLVYNKEKELLGRLLRQAKIVFPGQADEKVHKSTSSQAARSPRKGVDKEETEESADQAPDKPAAEEDRDPEPAQSAKPVNETSEKE